MPNLNISATRSRTVPNLHNHSNEQLMVMLHNIMKHGSSAAADTRKAALYQEWATRNQCFCSGQDTHVMAGDGVLSAFGYRVGDNGITRAAKRQLILDHVLEAPIPPLVSKDYTKKWGRPNTTNRKETLLRTLKGLVSGVNKRRAYMRDSYARAKSHWEQDIEYIQGLAV